MRTLPQSFSFRISTLAASLGLLALCVPASARAQTANNTATGTGALAGNTGDNNTADGYEALGSSNGGSSNCAVGVEALFSNTSGNENTAVGLFSLYANTGGTYNSGFGDEALSGNTTGEANTGVGVKAAGHNSTGSYNTAVGELTGYGNMTGNANTSVGSGAFYANSTGSDNVAIGLDALSAANDSYNVAVGSGALSDLAVGSGNIAIGYNAGATINSKGDNASAPNNIDIGSPGADKDKATIRIGTPGTQTAAFLAGVYTKTLSGGLSVVVGSNGQLGVATSSARFKDDIHDMSTSSDALYSLRPVSYRYKKEIDPAGQAQFGLVAEEVEAVDPALVVHGDDGKPYSVRYEQVNAMLLNEFLKEHARVQAQESAVREQAVAITRLEAANSEQAKALARQQEEFNAAMGQIKALSERIDGHASFNPGMTANVLAASDLLPTALSGQ